MSLFDEDTASSSSKHHHRSYVEISPTDSAFHSDDFSPETSRCCFGGDGQRSCSSDCPVWSPAGGQTRCRSEVPSSLGSGYVSGLGGLLSKEDDYLARSTGGQQDPDYAALQSQPWWESNWSLHSEPGYSRDMIPPVTGNCFVPLVIPVPDVVMKPRIGSL